MILTAAFTCLALSPGVATDGIGSTTEFSMSANCEVIASCATYQGSGGQVVMKNLRTKRTTAISTVAGNLANKPCNDIVVSASGDAIAFTSCASNLGANEDDGYNHLFVWDAKSNTVRAASNGLPKAYAKATLFYPAISDGATLTIFQAKTSGLPNRLWISEAGKQPQTLAARLKLPPPLEQDFCGTISPDGKKFYAIVKDPVYNNGQPLENPILISGSFESGQFTRSALPTFGPSTIYSVSNLKLSANGSVLGFGEVSKEGTKWSISYYLCDLTSSTYEFQKILTRIEGHSYYASAFALSGNGSVIVYQTNPDGVAYFGDQIYAYNWKTGSSELVSVSTGGAKVKKTLTLGLNGVNIHAISTDWDCSSVTFVSADPLGAYVNSHGGTTAEILVRDLVQRRTYRLQ